MARFTKAATSAKSIQANQQFQEAVIPRDKPNIEKDEGLTVDQPSSDQSAMVPVPQDGPSQEVVRLSGAPHYLMTIHLLLVADGTFSITRNGDGLFTALKSLAYTLPGWLRVKVYWAHRFGTNALEDSSFTFLKDQSKFVDFRHKVEVIDRTVPGEPFMFTGENLKVSKESDILFDQVWVFAMSAGQGALEDHEEKTLKAYMDQGYGVFATGDHGDAGLALLGTFPRVKTMLHFGSENATWPNTTDRANSSVMPDDTRPLDPPTQLDNQPVSIMVRNYPDYHLTEPRREKEALSPFLLLPRPRLPHWLLGAPEPYNQVTVLPDHQHEGQVMWPTEAALDKSFPHSFDDNQPYPWEVVASSWNYAFSSMVARKFDQARSLDQADEFGMVGAYNGFFTCDKVGRVAVDSSFHHWIELNIAPFYPEWSAREPERDDHAWLRLGDHAFQMAFYRANILTWLLPWPRQRDLAAHVFWHSFDASLLNQVIIEDLDFTMENCLKVGQDALRLLGRTYSLTFLRSLWIYLYFDDAEAAHQLLRESEKTKKGNRTFLVFDYQLEIMDECVTGGILISLRDLQELVPEPDTEQILNMAKEGADLGIQLFRNGYLNYLKRSLRILSKRIKG